MHTSSADKFSHTVSLFEFESFESYLYFVRRIIQCLQTTLQDIGKIAMNMSNRSAHLNSIANDTDDLLVEDSQGSKYEFNE